MHRAQRGEGIRHLGRQGRGCGVERAAEGCGGEQVEQDLDALVIDEGRDQDLEKACEARGRQALEVDAADHLAEGRGRFGA